LESIHLTVKQATGISRIIFSCLLERMVIIIEKKLRLTSMYRYALIGIDTVTKVAFAATSYSLKDKDVWNTAKEWFVIYGKPEVIHSDNGSSFISNCKIFFYYSFFFHSSNNLCRDKK
jgi:hypothetical protein